jgi:DNA-binding response OmpR family regulator
MRAHNTSLRPDRLELAFVAADSTASEPRSASIHLLSSSIKPGERLGAVRSSRMPPTSLNEMVELLFDVDGLPIQVRFLVKDVPADMQSHLVSLLSGALQRMVDRMHGSSLQNDAPSKQPLAIVELTSGGEASGRPPAPPNETALRVGPLELDLLDRSAKRGDRKIDLRPREFQLLKYMMQWSGKLLTRATLLQEVWHYRFVPETNLVDVHMGRLRRKVDGANELPMIRNIRGAGFVLGATAVSQDSQPTPAERSVLSLFQKERRNANRQHEPQHAI